MRHMGEMGGWAKKNTCAQLALASAALGGVITLLTRRDDPIATHIDRVALSLAAPSILAARRGAEGACWEHKGVLRVRPASVAHLEAVLAAEHGAHGRVDECGQLAAGRAADDPVAKAFIKIGLAPPLATPATALGAARLARQILAGALVAALAAGAAGTTR